jgi:uncharacterized small protein (DUF1192 family)
VRVRTEERHQRLEVRQVGTGEDLASHKTVAANCRSGRPAVIGDDPLEVYRARIAELEEEVATLKAELAKREASALLAAGDWRGEPPILVTADGTKGMERGVSSGRSRSARDPGTDE